MNLEEIIVSIIVPIRNEEKYIKNFIESLLNQDYPKNEMEIIFVDGISSDRTREIISEYIKDNDNLISIMVNEKKTAPYAMNIGIKNSVGRYVIRLDAHSYYKDDYISKCVECLRNIGADNVGGIINTIGKGFVGGCIAYILSSKFGVGNSQFRTSKKSGYVDTVPFGAFKRTAFNKYGYYDERLTRNQDIELNYRIRNNGGKIYQDHNIESCYYCRDSVSSFCLQAFNNGFWNIITYYLCPGSLSIRHFVPLVFVISLIMGLLSIIFNYMIFKFVFMLEFIVYLLLDIIFTVKDLKEKNIKKIIVIIFLFPCFHICYGAGSITAFLSLNKYNK